MAFPHHDDSFSLFLRLLLTIVAAVQQLSGVKKPAEGAGFFVDDA